MYKRHTGQVLLLETPEIFDSLPLDSNNDWIKLSKFVPWQEFDLKYADNFRSKKGQRACDSRMALDSVLIKIHYKGMSDKDLTKEIAMNPYLQHFLGLREYRYECPVDASMMTQFRQRISAEVLAWVIDEIIGRRQRTVVRCSTTAHPTNSPDKKHCARCLTSHISTCTNDVPMIPIGW